MNETIVWALSALLIGAESSTPGFHVRLKASTLDDYLLYFSVLNSILCRIDISSAPWGS